MKIIPLALPAIRTRPDLMTTKTRVEEDRVVVTLAMPVVITRRLKRMP